MDRVVSGHGTIVDETSSWAYRADIDGLRAIAILAVVLFHLDRSWVPGGFAGVDIFFVISGYLITGHIAHDLHTNRFSFAEFYRRRIKRIVPVLLFVVFCTLIVGNVILLQIDLRDLTYSSLASIFFVANVYFTYFLDFSYFSDDSQKEPLLHIWSLGVEEQFYILWPAIAVLLLRWSRRASALALAATGTVFLFALSEALVRTAPIFAYYMLPARAGELTAGAMLALAPRRRFGFRHAGLMAAPAGLAGLALVGWSLAVINEGRPFPGMNALPVTLGTALVILSGTVPTNPVSRLLAVRPMVWLGLLSYSLYLWHWPVVAFIRYVTGGLSTALALAGLAAMLVLSVVSYRLVELPCRASRRRFRRVLAVQFLIPAMLLSLLCLAIVSPSSLGVSPTDSQPLRPIAANREPAEPAYMYNYGCQHNTVTVEDMRDPDCIINGDREPSVLLWGDSNAAHYIGMIGAFAYEAGFAFRNIAHSACPPLLHDGPRFARPAYTGHCTASLAVVLPALARYSTLMIAADWTDYTGLHSDFLDAQFSTLDLLRQQGKTIVLLGRAPIMQSVDQECEAKSANLSWIDCKKRADFVRSEKYPVNEALAAYAASHDGVYYFDVDDVVCPKGRCSPYLGNELVYYDNAHFSMDGSWTVGRRIVAEGLMPDFFRRLGASR